MNLYGHFEDDWDELISLSENNFSFNHPHKYDFNTFLYVIWECNRIDLFKKYYKYDDSPEASKFNRYDSDDIINRIVTVYKHYDSIASGSIKNYYAYCIEFMKVILKDEGCSLAVIKQLKSYSLDWRWLYEH